MSSLDVGSDGGAAPLDLRVNLFNQQQTLGTIVDRARIKKGYTLFTVNLDHMVKLRRNRPFREAYKRAEFITADGWPIVWLIREAGRGLERTTGADLVEPLCKQAAIHGLPLYFVGPSEASQTDGLAVLKSRYDGLAVAGAECPNIPADFSDDVVEALAARVNASGARICILSLGAPKQELLADALLTRCPDVGFLCVGAALDFISGHAVRAPQWMQRGGLEWFWRLVTDPKRLAMRYASCAYALFKLACPSLFRKTPRVRLAEAQ